MRATLMYGAGDVRVETVPNPEIQEPTDAIVRILRAAICGSDLHPYHGMAATGQGRNMGHEFLGIVEDVGSAVTGLKHGDLVVASFLYQDNTCEFCAEGLQTSCPHGGRYGFNGVGGGQAEAIWVPQSPRHPGQAAGQRGLSAPAGPAHPGRRAVHRLPRRGQGWSRTAHHRHGDR
jgi:threonine dehydrogenase-like Zn-dependent dehydrogenase